LETTAFSNAQVHQRGNTLQVAHGGDDSLIVAFYMESELQGFASEEAGRPIYKDVPYIWIRFPGDRTREVKRRVDTKGKNGYPDQDRFPRQWAAFQRGQQDVQEGTPLEQWSAISRSTALTYKGMNIFTVENLAAVNDSSLQAMGHGAREMRDKAIAWLKSSEDGAEAMRLAAENKRKDDRIEALENQLSELAAKVDGKKK
jgi:hypothetical protein